LEWIIAKALKDAGRLKKKKNEIGKENPGKSNE
jgi:hypothetical protein